MSWDLAMFPMLKSKTWLGVIITTYSLSTTDDHLSPRVEISLDKIVRPPQTPV